MQENQRKTEVHPLEPFLPLKAKVLMLGSFPPPRARWCMDFYYPNMQNDMWRILGLVFWKGKDYFLTDDRRRFCKERIVDFLIDRGIAISDMAREVVRLQDNASDKFLEVVTPVDLRSLLRQLPNCDVVITTGQKATDTLLELTGGDAPRVGGYTMQELDNRRIRLYRMPSSSRAYPKPIEEKALAYGHMFRELGMI